MEARDMPRDLTKADTKQMFTNEAQDIINWKGDNFYKSCDELVTGDPVNGPATFCLKRVNHPGYIHEDWEGNQNLVITDETKISDLNPADIVTYNNRKYKVGEELISTGGHVEYRYILTPLG